MSETALTVPPGRYRLTNVVRAELAKITTLPSTAIILGVTLVVTLLLTGLVTHGALNQPHDPRFFDATQVSLTGLIVAGLTGGVFGALLITGEYSSNTIRASLGATPRRGVLLAAKVSVTALVTLVFCEILSFLSFFLGQNILSGGAPSATLATPGALRAVTMTGAFIALLSLMSFGFGLICRSTAGAIASFAGVVFVLPLVLQGVSIHAAKYTPAGLLINSVMATVPQGNNPVSPGIGLLLMAIYAAATLVAGAVLFAKRDA